MTNQHTVPLETKLSIIREWDAAVAFGYKPSPMQISRKLGGIDRGLISRTIAKREEVLARAQYEGLPVLPESPTQQSESVQDSYQVVSAQLQNPTPSSGTTQSQKYEGHPLISNSAMKGSTHLAQGGNARSGKLDILLIPDVQAKPDIDFDHLTWAGRYAADKKPDVIVCIGDFADMPSCSFHDEPGSKAYSDQNYKADILATHLAMKSLMAPIQQEMASGWAPRLVMTLGNHEDRINRMIEAIPKLDGLMGLPDLEYERWGWEVYPFLVPIVIKGIAFCHYFASGVMGRPITTAQALLTKKHQSCVAGHQQGRDLKYAYRGDGKEMFALIAGSFYRHDEKYLNHQTNQHYRGLYMMYGCEDGVVESPVAVTMDYLQRTYGPNA